MKGFHRCLVSHGPSNIHDSINISIHQLGPKHELCILCVVCIIIYVETRAHKNGQLEQEHVTPIEACSPGKIIELLLKIEHQHV